LGSTSTVQTRDGSRAESISLSTRAALCRCRSSAGGALIADRLNMVSDQRDAHSELVGDRLREVKVQGRQELEQRDIELRPVAEAAGGGVVRPVVRAALCPRLDVVDVVPVLGQREARAVGARVVALNLLREVGPAEPGPFDPGQLGDVRLGDALVHEPKSSTVYILLP
jgi:hypothetical protein